MREEIIGLLINGDRETLCSSFGLLPFQASMLEFYYKNINSMHTRTTLVNQIASNYYSSEEKKNEMAKSYLEKAILFAKDHGKNILMNRCGLTEEQSIEFINEYLKNNSNLTDMLSAELDVANTNKIMSGMMEEIIPTFLKSQNQVKVMKKTS